ncbi:MAG: DNA-3-methyladenine glycosylase I [Promethearchaeota archaeon]
MVQRCWQNLDNLMRDYHDKEWGVPLHDDRKLFEFLVLDGAQAGLSWKTILKKREACRIAFDGFDFEKIAEYNENNVEELLNNRGIIRNRLKINAFITNARSFIRIRQEFSSFDRYIWQFVKNKTIKNKWKSWEEVPSKTGLSVIISKDLKKRGFKFVGPVIIYAFMQAIGMVNDHLVKCFRYKELTE